MGCTMQFPDLGRLCRSCCCCGTKKHTCYRQKQRLRSCRESVAINTSLMTLGRCLEALRWNQTHPDAELRLVPYRESKITHLFRDALHGWGQILLSVNVSPVACDYDETSHVLKVLIDGTQRSSMTTSDSTVASYTWFESCTILKQMMVVSIVSTLLQSWLFSEMGLTLAAIAPAVCGIGHSDRHCRPARGAAARHPSSGTQYLKAAGYRAAAACCGCSPRQRLAPRGVISSAVGDGAAQHCWRSG